MEARARRHRRPGRARARGPAPARGAPPGPDVLAGHRRRGPAHRAHRRLRRVHRRPARPLREAADDRRHDARDRGRRGERGHDRRTRSRERRSRAPRSPSPRPAASSRTASPRTPTAAGPSEVQLRRGRNEFTVSAVDPETGKPSETTQKVFITVPFLVIEAPTLNVDSPAEGAQFENGAIPVKGTTTNAKTVAVSAVLTGPADGQPVATAKPDAKPVDRRPHDRGGGLGRHVRDAARPVHRQVADHGDRHLGGGEGRHPHAQRRDRLQGRQPGREDQGRPRVDQGLGRRQGVEGDRARRAGCTARARP